jgi:4-amino-4-deoxy-L-arabinose transferase-like glycosyltransferase
LQAPVAVYQRFAAESIGIKSGDWVIGTLMSSGILSIFLIAVICVMAGLMLRGQMSRLWFGVCFVLLMIPMSINETKMTIFVLPVTLLLTFLVAAPRGRKLLVTIQALCFLVIAGVIFVPIYDYYNKDVPGQFSVEDFLSNGGEFAKYMDRKAKVGTEEEAGRMDSLRAPFIALSRDPIKLVFGLGLGNASKSSLGEQFTGRYKPLYWNFVLELSLTAFLFELGLLGTSLVFVMLWMFLRDAVFVAKHDKGLLGAIALGYIGAWATITIGLVYLAIHAFEAISFTFFFFSGVVATRREQLAMSRAKVNRPLPVGLVPMKPKAR